MVRPTHSRSVFLNTQLTYLRILLFGILGFQYECLSPMYRIISCYDIHDLVRPHQIQHVIFHNTTYRSI